ncbi:MAG: hypothetical protein NTW19_07425 [Planctomycetota bacterium]|nr:hypothetical protein [Planctomycetota bacterium]
MIALRSALLRIVPLVLLLLTVSPARAAELPHEHVYQRALRDFLLTLKEADFVIDTSAQPPRDQMTLDDCYRDWVWLKGEIPLPTAGLAIPAKAFTMQAVESPAGVMRPNVSPSDMARLAMWNHPGNPFLGSPGLRRRAMVVAVIDMVMHDELHEKKPDSGANRSDFLGGTLIWLAYSYPAFREFLPLDAQKAYEDGLRKLVARIINWGPRASMTDMDLFAPVGMAYVAQALDDREIERVARHYAQTLFTDPRFFRKAGYFVDNGCYDTSYNGISLYFASWAARLVDWPFVHEAVDRAYRLRSALFLPEPRTPGDTNPIIYRGPSHMSSRTSGDPPHEQWNWIYRHVGSAMTTDHDLWMAPIPSEEELRAAPKAIAAALQLAADSIRPVPPAPPATAPAAGTPTPAPAAPEPASSSLWRESHWGNSNFAADHYLPGFYDRLAKLRAEKSPLLLPPFLRPGSFIENFDDTFLVAKLKGFGVVIHTGPVAGDDNRWRRPRGFGGGALSAYWTPEAGPVLLGRRRGIQGATFDTYDDWRIWPIHAITGLTAAGKPISSARTLLPKATYDVGKENATIVVKGTFNPQAGAITAGDPKADAAAPTTFPANQPGGPTLLGSIDYTRTFEVTPAGLRVESSVRGDGRDPLAELYEVIPVFLGDNYVPPTPESKTPDAKNPGVDLFFRVKEAWIPATPEPVANVAAIRVDRQFGAVLIELDSPRTVRLSPTNWVDGYQTGATCRNIMVDLLGKPGPLQAAGAKVAYRVTPTARPVAATAPSH